MASPEGDGHIYDARATVVVMGWLVPEWVGYAPSNIDACRTGARMAIRSLAPPDYARTMPLPLSPHSGGSRMALGDYNNRMEDCNPPQPLAQESVGLRQPANGRSIVAGGPWKMGARWNNVANQMANNGTTCRSSN